METKDLPRATEGVGVWEHYTLRDGLPDMKIECLFEDSRGRLWIGTHDRGAVCFDGERFEVFTTEDGLAADCVFSIVEDGEGMLWFGTPNGLTRYDEGEFRVVGELAGRLWGNLCLDDRGRLWVGTYGHGLYCYDATRFQTFGKVQGVSDDRINCLAEDGEGILWIGTQAGLTGYDGAGFRILEEDEALSHWAILSLLADGEKQLWISTFGQLYAHRDGAFELVVEDWGMGYLTSLASDVKGRTWLGLRFGWRSDQARHGYAYYQDGQVCAFPREAGEESPSEVSALLVDRRGRLWVGPTDLEQYPGLCRRDEAGIGNIPIYLRLPAGG